MEGFEGEGLFIGVTSPSGTIRLDWTGQCGARKPGELLAPFFDGVLERAAQQGSALEMHFERLAHLNSSTIAFLIKLIQTSKQRGLRLSVVYDGGVGWQRTSFETLRIFEHADGGFEVRRLT